MPLYLGRVVRVAQSVWRLSYGLEGPGTESGWGGGGEIFRPSTPALGPTQPSIK
jgi:hypothetical protein